MLRLTPRLQDEHPAPLVDAGLPLQLARVLWARGVRTKAEADAFLNPDPADLHDPMRLHGMEDAVARIRAAIEGGERITVYGDYDVDGVCAASLLVEALRAHGAHAASYIPSRHREGYGLNADAVRNLSTDTDLLITVDCGITNVEEVALAGSLGMDVIVTDHHEPPEVLPDAVTVIDPLLGDYPFPRLCGAGVAFKLVWALFGPEAVDALWELAALATVADLVPLLGENRIIAAEGLRRMQDTRRPGLKALIEVSGLTGKTLTAGHLGFQLGPRMNAGGRLYDASRNVELLLTDDTAVAAEIAAALHRENAERQRVEQSILAQAIAWTEENVDFLTDRVILVVGDGWNTGVVGLVASRLVERFAWPAVVLSKTEDGLVTGSARSIPGVNLHAALTRCADLFIRFGGHAQAAGMTLAPENVDALRARLNEAIEAVAEPDAFIPSAPYDLDIQLGEVTIPLIEQLDRLAPTGFGNPSPVFRLTRAQVLEARTVGADGKHLKLRLSQDGAALDGIAFGQGAQRAGLPETVDALFSPSINEYMGRRSAQCEVARILPHAPHASFAATCRARADAFDCYLLDQRDDVPTPVDEDVLQAQVRAALADGYQGTLLTVRTLAGAQRWLAWLEAEGLSDRLDYCFEAPTDSRRFHTLCATPSRDAADGFRQVIALDDALVRDAVAAWLPDDGALRGLYRTLRAGPGRYASEAVLADASGLRLAAVRLGLIAFGELSLIDYRPVPFAAALLPPRKCSLMDSETLRAVRTAWAREEME